MILSDADTIPNYENVIRNIHYYHNKPENLANRTLTLYCSSQNQRFTSTKFIERVSLLVQLPSFLFCLSDCWVTMSVCVQQIYIQKVDF